MSTADTNATESGRAYAGRVGPADSTDSPAPGRVAAVRPPTAARVWFALCVYALATLLASAILLAVQPHSGIDPAALSLVQFGPAMGGLVTWLMCRRTIAGVLPAAVSVRRVGVNLAAIVAVCVTYWSLITLAGVVAGTATVGPAAVGAVPFAVFLVLQFVGAGGEEIGWRGLMQPMLESRMAKVAAVSATGAGWALWHVQAFTAGLVIAVCFFVATLAFAVVLGYLGTGSFWQRVLVASIGHWLINIAGYLVAGDGTLDRTQIVFVAAAAVVVAAGSMGLRALGRSRSKS
ncbi:type II CAAX endopeptidase family protein [Nocardia neocaledoniensis]|uniref:type II CAAX endopeptidase family protein n=1 Tax=Nocardia neocaledoniensis TaxID=236511 RepID=UPI0024559A62|nr:type II CAAX endopeptidase family protein [Nocardia neocaledoniensis]